MLRFLLSFILLASPVFAFDEPKITCEQRCGGYCWNKESTVLRYQCFEACELNDYLEKWIYELERPNEGKKESPKESFKCEGKNCG